jgi:hypothetical protein
MAASIEKRIERLEDRQQREASKEQERKESSNRSGQDFMNKFLKMVDYWLEKPDDDPSKESIASLFARKAALKWASAPTTEEGWTGIQEVLDEIGKAFREYPRFGGQQGHRQWCIEHGLLLSPEEKGNVE